MDAIGVGQTALVFIWTTAAWGPSSDMFKDKDERQRQPAVLEDFQRVQKAQRRSLYRAAPPT